MTNPQMIQSNIEDIKVEYVRYFIIYLLSCLICHALHAPWPALQAHSPDYANMELEDFLARIENYMAVYQTMGEEHEGDMSFLKVIIATPHQSSPHHAATQNQTGIYFFCLQATITKQMAAVFDSWCHFLLCLYFLSQSIIST